MTTGRMSALKVTTATIGAEGARSERTQHAIFAQQPEQAIVRAVAGMAHETGVASSG